MAQHFCDPDAFPFNVNKMHRQTILTVSSVNPTPNKSKRQMTNERYLSQNGTTFFLGGNLGLFLSLPPISPVFNGSADLVVAPLKYLISTQCLHSILPISCLLQLAVCTGASRRNSPRPHSRPSPTEGPFWIPKMAPSPVLLPRT